jgi:hypothetical protein
MCNPYRQLSGQSDQIEKRICPYCGKPMVKHIIQEGARFHVTSYHGSPNGALSHCSEKDCENNHGEGHCVPYSEETKCKMREYDMKRRVKDMHPDSFRPPTHTEPPLFPEDPKKKPKKRESKEMEFLKEYVR